MLVLLLRDGREGILEEVHALGAFSAHTSPHARSPGLDGTLFKEQQRLLREVPRPSSLAAFASRLGTEDLVEHVVALTPGIDQDEDLTLGKGDGILAAVSGGENSLQHLLERRLCYRRAPNVRRRHRLPKAIDVKQVHDPPGWVGLHLHNGVLVQGARKLRSGFPLLDLEHNAVSTVTLGIQHDLCLLVQVRFLGSVGTEEQSRWG